MQAAPAYWRDLDPYWQGSGAPPMRRYFHPDGSITADANDTVWGGHESSYTIVTGLLTDGKIREHYVRINRWPKMTVHRKSDWSWALYNRLYCYTSIPDADNPAGTGPPFPIFRWLFSTLQNCIIICFSCALFCVEFRTGWGWNLEKRWCFWDGILMDWSGMYHSSMYEIREFAIWDGLGVRILYMYLGGD